MLTLRYPPSLATGTIRTLKLQKYLPEFGWVGDVLTAHGDGQAEPLVVEPAREGPGKTYRLRFFDPVRNAERLEIRTNPSGWDRLRARSLRRLAGYALVPDGQALFAGAAFLHAARIADGHDALFATGMPWSGLVAAVTMNLRTRLPVVLDLRDPWIEVTGDRYGRLQRRVERTVEGWALRRADAIVVTADGLRRELAARRPTLAERIHVIPNGYDEEDFRAISRPAREGITILHTGNFYGSKGPAPLFDGIRTWLQKWPDRRPTLRLRLIGHVRRSDVEAARAAGLADVVSFEGPVPHEDAVRSLGSAHIFVAVDYGREQASTRVLSKIFEYLRAGRPIVLLSNGGCTAELLRPVSRAFVVPRDEPATFAEQLERIVRELPACEAELPANDIAWSYERRVIAQRFSSLLEETARRRK